MPSSPGLAHPRTRACGRHCIALGPAEPIGAGPGATEPAWLKYPLIGGEIAPVPDQRPGPSVVDRITVRSGLRWSPVGPPPPVGPAPGVTLSLPTRLSAS